MPDATPRAAFRAALCLAAPLALPAQDPAAPFAIEVVDAATGRGVPLAVLRTTNELLYVTDSAGRVAFDEPGLLGEEVWFHVASHGYEHARDGFGFAGVRLATSPGGHARVELERVNVAERLYRVTGQGIYRDTVRLGEEAPVRRALLAGGVLGQDSVVTARLGDRVLWFWGDTNRASYPLGEFEVTGAWSAPPARLDPDVGIDLQYFTGDDGFARAMCPIEGPGPVWIGGLVVVPDEGGEDVLVAHYARVKTLGVLHEQGLARWDPERERFEKWKELPLDADLHPAGHPVRVTDGGTAYWVFPVPYPTVRVPATLAAVGDPATYEGFTCLVPGAVWSADAPVERDAHGDVVWGWKRGTAPVGEERERELLRSGRLTPDEALVRLRDVETGAPVRAHNGSVRWNAHRGRWVWILGEAGGDSSYLGEVWYAEADTLAGPWRHARKVVTHESYSFYNVAQHDFLAREGGRYVYFEGTYTRTFSKAAAPTPRYDYNQVMYRLDLDDPRLVMPAVDSRGTEAEPLPPGRVVRSTERPAPR